MYAYYIVPSGEFDAAEFGRTESMTDFDDEVHVIQEIGLHRLADQNRINRDGGHSHLRAVFFNSPDAYEYQRMLTE